MRGRPGCPTGQKKTSVGATGGSPPLFYKERLGTESPPHPPQCAHWGTYGLWWLRLDLTEQSPGLFDPRGEGFGGGKSPSRLQNHPSQPAQLVGGPLRALENGPQARQKKREDPRRVPPNQKRWVQGGRTSSSLVFFPPAFFQRKPGPRPGPGRQRGAAPRGSVRAPTTRRVRSTAPEQETPGRLFSQILILLIPLQRLHADLVVQNPLPQAEGLGGDFQQLVVGQEL